MIHPLVVPGKGIYLVDASTNQVLIVTHLFSPFRYQRAPQFQDTIDKPNIKYDNSCDDEITNA